MTHKEMAEKIKTALGLDEEPIAAYYSDEKPEGAYEWNCTGGHFCTVTPQVAVRKGKPLAINGKTPGCGGTAFFLGWSKEMRPGFEEFLSHDAEGKGERYKKTPEIARAFIENREFVPANGQYCIFQRLIDVPEEITPEVVDFYADADGISGLVWLANYGRKEQAVIAPFTAGCGSLVSEPRAQMLKDKPKAVLGMFDPSARISVEKHLLSFAVPWKMFVEMLENLPGSFVEIEPWTKIRNR